MNRDDFEKKLDLVAQAYEMAPNILLENIRHALGSSGYIADTSIDEMIPHSGGSLTLEDYVEYLARTLPRPFEP